MRMRDDASAAFGLRAVSADVTMRLGSSKIATSQERHKRHEAQRGTTFAFAFRKLNSIVGSLV